MMPPNLQVTSEVFWRSALLFAVVDVLLVSLLAWRGKPALFRELSWAVAGSSAIFWGMLGSVMVWGFWDSYYRYFFPDSARWFGPLFAALFGAIGFALWWLACRLPGNSILNFSLLGACEGLLEHLWGIYGLGILQKVPMLQNASAPSVLVFSFFEYMLYWGIVLAIAALFQSAWRRSTRLRQIKDEG